MGNKKKNTNAITAITPAPENVARTSVDTRVLEDCYLAIQRCLSKDDWFLPNAAPVFVLKSNYNRPFEFRPDVLTDSEDGSKVHVIRVGSNLIGSTDSTDTNVRRFFTALFVGGLAGLYYVNTLAANRRELPLASADEAKGKVVTKQVSDPFCRMCEDAGLIASKHDVYNWTFEISDEDWGSFKAEADELHSKFRYFVELKEAKESTKGKGGKVIKVSDELHAAIKSFCEANGLKIEDFADTALTVALPSAAEAPKKRGKGKKAA
jgi:hypothetical protein